MQCASSMTTSPAEAVSFGSTRSRKSGLLSRSGLTSRTSVRAGPDFGVDLLPFLCVGRIDRAGVDAGPLRGSDLVAHQREQRGHDDSGPSAARPAAARSRRNRRRTCPTRYAARQARGAARRRGPGSRSTGHRGAVHARLRVPGGTAPLHPGWNRGRRSRLVQPRWPCPLSWRHSYHPVLWSRAYGLSPMPASVLITLIPRGFF